MLTQAEIANRLGDHFVLSPHGPQGFLDKLASLGLRVIEDRPAPSVSDEELIEAMAAHAHAAWMEGQRFFGVTSRRADWGEEFMVPFDQLSQKGQDFDRFIMGGILRAFREQHMVVIADQPDHIIDFRPEGWQIQHSIECRVQGKLLDCDLHNAVVFDCEQAPGGEMPEFLTHGRYRVTFNEQGETYYERIEDAVG